MFLKFYNFKQKELTIEEYVAKFGLLMMKCDIFELKEQTTAQYIGGLKNEIANVVQLQPYLGYNGACKLTLKVEKQRKEYHGHPFLLLFLIALLPKQLYQSNPH